MGNKISLSDDEMKKVSCFIETMNLKKIGKEQL